MESAIYEGTVRHQRFTPTQHQFSYDLTLFWLKLAELPMLTEQFPSFSYNKRNWLQFSDGDYLNSSSLPITQKVREQASSLGLTDLNLEIFMLGQIRMFGVYFSPVNFYFFRQPSGRFSHMMAEVSNTPWHEKHCYLVKLESSQPNQPITTEKQFHVSPFNPMDMQYLWRIKPPEKHCDISLECHKDQRHFSASIHLQQKELNRKTLRNVMVKTPSISVKTLLGIYWQALKLFVKGTPIYSHPKKGTK